MVSLDMAYRSFREVLAGLTPASIRRPQSIVVSRLARAALPLQCHPSWAHGGDGDRRTRRCSRLQSVRSGHHCRLRCPVGRGAGTRAATGQSAVAAASRDNHGNWSVRNSDRPSERIQAGPPSSPTPSGGCLCAIRASRIGFRRRSSIARQRVRN